MMTSSNSREKLSCSGLNLKPGKKKCVGAYQPKPAPAPIPSLKQDFRKNAVCFSQALLN
jgi:hypothetical protein